MILDLPDHAGFETHEHDVGIAHATGSFVQEALEKDKSTFKSMAGFWVTDRLNAMGYLGDSKFRPVRPGGWSLASKGGGQTGIPNYGNPNYRTRTSIGRVPQHMATANKIKGLIDKNEAVWRVFKILQQPPSWVGYNLILEEIAYERGLNLGTLHQSGIITSSEINAFKKAANTNREISQGPRHSRNHNATPSTNPIVLGDTLALIRTTVRKWIDLL